MHTPTIPAHHEGNGFDLLFLVQVLKSFLFYTQLVYSNRLAEEKAGHLYAVCLLPDAKARRRAGLTAPARARCRPCPVSYTHLWKVYGDEAKAQALFAKFKKCTEIYCALWQTGSKLEQLAVAV